MSDQSPELQEGEDEGEEIRLPDHPILRPDAQLIKLDDIQPMQNVRQYLGNVEGLAENIRVRGLLHPVVVRPAQDTSHGKPYELIVGYRRLQAFKDLDKQEIPGVVHTASDQEMLAEVISENHHRENHSPLDEARTMQRMIDTFDWSHAQVAKQLGVDRSQVTKRLGLLRLPEKVQEMVQDGRLSASHAEVVNRLDNAESQVELAELAVKKDTPVAKLHSYASALKERDDQKLHPEDPEAKEEDPNEPLDELTDDQIIQLPALQVKDKLSTKELRRAELYILLRNSNDEEMLDVLAELHGVAWGDLWYWVAGLSDEEVEQMVDTMIRRWLGAGHRYPTLPEELREYFGEGEGDEDNRPDADPPAGNLEDDDEDWDPEEWGNEEPDWDEEFDDGQD